MSYDYATCKRFLECLFGFGALDKIKFQEQVRIVRGVPPPPQREVSPSGEVTGHLRIACGNCIAHMVPHSKAIPDFGECSGSAMLTNIYPHSEEFGTVIKDDHDTNVESEKNLSLEQKLELAIAKKIFNKPKYNIEISYIQNHLTRNRFISR
ncbi:hypothetical protein TNCV_5105511 [Trichonephila clavipes]|nr:hypothetical protein TNCV_5105511 [Trichonephila clavipes]